MKAPFPLIGYHGCSQDTAEKIISGRDTLKDSDAENEWLGTGVYFWNNDPQRALEWAKHKKIKNPYVIGAIIIPEKLLDFSTREAAPLVDFAFKWLDEEYRNNDKTLPPNSKYGDGDLFYKNRKRDCLVMNALHKISGKKYDVFSAPFLEGKRLHDTFFLEQTHVQICVKKLDAIVGYFVPSAAHNLNLPPLFSAH